MALVDSSILPADIIEFQLATIDLIAAMYPSAGELEIPESTAECIEKLRNWCQNPTATLSQIPTSISLTVCLSVADGDKTIQVNISVPLTTENQHSIDEPPPLGYSLRQPDWMSKAEVAEISSVMPKDDALEAFEYVQTECARFLETKQRQALASEAPNMNTRSRGPLVRVWFYFPSLSTRKKRDDMVNLAPGYSLTGFVLAGKPGVLCLEGLSPDIDAYMSFIKTHSWGDIPSHQKKVSERFRETEDVSRVFPGMEEITGSLGNGVGSGLIEGTCKLWRHGWGVKGCKRRLQGSYSRLFD